MPTPYLSLTLACSCLARGGSTEKALRLHSSRIEVAIITETKWTFTNCWTDAHFHYIHSGCAPKSHDHGGVLIIISRQLTAADAIRYHEEIPGRLLRVAFTPHGSSRMFNLVGLYQHVWKPGNLSLRHTFWTKLSGMLHSVPARSCLVVAGDYNATCRPEGRLVGHGVPTSYTAEDSSELQDILRAHGLVALNTFGAAPAYTFKFGPRRSQLDYVCTRLAHADRHAKQAFPDQDFPVARHVSEDAAFHYPVQASLACSWPHRTKPTHQANVDVQRLAQDVQTRQVARYNVPTQQAQAWAHRHPNPQDPDACLQDLNHSLLDKAVDLFPAQKPVQIANIHVSL